MICPIQGTLFCNATCKPSINTLREFWRISQLKSTIVLATAIIATSSKNGLCKELIVTNLFMLSMYFIDNDIAYWNNCITWRSLTILYMLDPAILITCTMSCFDLLLHWSIYSTLSFLFCLPPKHGRRGEEGRLDQYFPEFCLLLLLSTAEYSSSV